MITIYIKRMVSVYKRKGLYGTFKHILYKIYRNSIKKERFIFCAESHCKENKIQSADRVTIKVYKEFGSIPSQLMQNALEIQTLEMIRWDWERKLTHGEYLWVAYNSSQEAVGLAWSVRKQHYNFPFFPMTERDCVLYDVFIFNKHRNRGYGASMMQSIIEHILSNGIDRVYIDISSWNIPSLKMIRKLEYDLLGLARYSVGKKGATISWRHNYAEIFERLTQ